MIDFSLYKSSLVKDPALKEASMSEQADDRCTEQEDSTNAIHDHRMVIPFHGYVLAGIGGQKRLSSLERIVRKGK
jgi:hypothetical protein